MRVLLIYIVLFFGLILQNSQASHLPLVDSFDALHQVCKSIQSKEYIALDIEFVGQQPCLIQVCWGEGDTDGAIIDYLALQRTKPARATHALGSFKTVLDNPAITKVFHAPTQDLKLLYRLTGSLPKSVVDTQAMYAMTTPHYQAGYAAVVAIKFQVVLDKSQQCSDWTKRPLSQAQGLYASRDVTYLYRLYPILCADVERLGRQSFMVEYFKRTITPEILLQKRSAQTDDNTNAEDFVRTLMSTLKKRAESLSMAPQMIATRANFQDVLEGDVSNLIVGERGKLLGWEVQFLLNTYDENPALTSSWTTVLQSLKKATKV
jgi:ribonuclease D